ncbi:transposase family protein [Streptomyces atriruber]|uniref:Transposase family protein n=1 Tax=Streptomyces atriruber TaxID=545121 RepID=A0ABV3BEB8_9ACTN
MSAAPSSPVPAVLMQLGSLGPDDVTDVRPFLDAVPDPRSRRGRWYPLASILLICATATVSGARSIDELAEWGARADTGLLNLLGMRRHPPGWRQGPSRSTIGRVLERLDGDALDAAIGSWLAGRLLRAHIGRSAWRRTADCSGTRPATTWTQPRTAPPGRGHGCMS